MISFGKFAFYIAATLCLVQFAVGRLELDKLLFENIRFDLGRNCANLERDMEKDFANARHKLIKESAKLGQKAKTPDAVDCIETARMQAEVDLTDKSQEVMNCVKELRDALDTDLKPEASLRETFTFRNVFKNKLRACKNTARLNLKMTQNEFSLAGKRCLV